MFFVYFCQTIGKEEKTSDMRIEEILAMEIGDRQFCRTEIQADDVERVLRAALLATCGKEGNSVELYPVEDPHLLERLADARDHGAECIAQAPMAVAVVADRLYDGAGGKLFCCSVGDVCAGGRKATGLPFGADKRLSAHRRHHV